MKRNVIVVGAGLSGLRAASILVDRGYGVTVIERAPMAGGCTSSWRDHRDPDGGSLRKGMMQMNFSFYENLNYFAWRELLASGTVTAPAAPPQRSWWHEQTPAFSPQNAGFYFIDGDERRSYLSDVPGSAMGRLLNRLPAPLSALQVLWDFDGLPSLRDKLSTVKFHVLALLFGEKAVPPLNDDLNFYATMRQLGLTHEAVKAYRRITYSISNLADADQVGPKFLHLFYQTYLRDRNILGCRMMADDCNPALIDPIVASLRRRGVAFRFHCHLADILVENGRCAGLKVIDHSGAEPVVCPNCGLEFRRSAPTAFCPACGHTWHDPRNAGAPADWMEADAYVSALQPHQLAWLFRRPDDHPLRNYPEFRVLGQFKGAALTVSRVYMDRKVCDRYNLTGLDRDYWSLNGAMDISTVMPGHAASVFDTLSDDGEVLEYYPEQLLKEKLRADLGRIFPEMAGAKVERHLAARIAPSVLYHRGFPRLNSRFLPRSSQTPLGNFFLAGDWMDELELGMEAAVKGGVRAANALLEWDGLGHLAEPLYRPTTAPLVRWLQTNALSRFIRSRYEKRYAAEAPPRRG